MKKYIYIHCHVNFKTFKEDGDEVIRRALDADTWLFNVGSQYTTSERAVEIAHRYLEGVYAIVGLHPIHLEEAFHDEDEVGGEGFMSRKEEFDREKYLKLAQDPKVVAIGECGLDYYHMNRESIEKQKKAFTLQIELAQEVGKPLMLHIRNAPYTSPQPSPNIGEGELNAYADVAEILKKYPGIKGVSHFFAGSVEDMKRFVAMGIYVSFAGHITYKPKPEICDYVGVI